MLTPAQLTLIDKHLRSDNWLLNNDLIAELTDHYVDAISDKLIQGIPFNLALLDVHRSFGGRKGLLNMEENYQQTQAQTNSRVYRNSVKKAFQLPGLGYTLLVWAVCYGLVRTFPFKWVSEHIYHLSDVVFLGMMCVFVGIFIYAFVLHFRQLRAGTLSLHSWAAPTYTMVQSTAFVGYLCVFLPVRHFAETHPASCALVMTLVVIHEWAGMNMLAFVYRKRLAV
ncbi:hypothetical protein [Fibrivirga algicola]|uniref:Uncharacterized protein n=1 Tax=Fibrivirga algicola TaxID=2950420 RepID=A0ABX0QMF7_9BACT|nr:hypothetical protein [Fibrivirga algicola]NID12062.1 hypothetical protein [Fibrivirga algicola]